MIQALLVSGDIEEHRHSYRITGKAINTLSEYEVENRRHTEAINQTTHIKWLTGILAIVGIIQVAIVYLSSS